MALAPPPQNDDQKQSISLSKLKYGLLAVSLILIGVVAYWYLSGANTFLKTSTLNTSFNRLTSTPVNINIEPAGQLNVSAGPSPYLGNAVVFAITLASSEASPSNETPFLVNENTYKVIFNAVNPNDTATIQLDFKVPPGTIIRRIK